MFEKVGVVGFDVVAEGGEGYVVDIIAVFNEIVSLVFRIWILGFDIGIANAFMALDGEI